MSNGRHTYPRACWRCQFWGGFADPSANHSLCKRGDQLQAEPTRGCAYWVSGPGNSMPPEWTPDGFQPTEKRMIWGPPPPPPAPAAPDPRLERPHMPSAQFAFDQKAEAAAWRATDELMQRARRAG